MAAAGARLSDGKPVFDPRRMRRGVDPFKFFSRE
jgi:hypothetical protein